MTHQEALAVIQDFAARAAQDLSEYIDDGHAKRDGVAADYRRALARYGFARRVLERAGPPPADMIRRTQFGRDALDAGTPDRGDDGDRTDAIDTIANILHYLSARDLTHEDIDAVLASARRHWDIEQWEAQR